MQNFSNDQATSQKLPAISDFKGLTNFFTSDSPNELLETTEKRLWAELGLNNARKQPSYSFRKTDTDIQNDLFNRKTKPKVFRSNKTDGFSLVKSPDKIRAKLGMLEHEINKRRVSWACISAESQREKKTETGVYYECNIYDNLTTISPKFERDTGFTPPDNTGNYINRFSKRSRKRLMNRARRLNKQNIPLPYFVTLTYAKNFTDCERAKSHLNAFLQRWRNKHEDFAYFWKMEPQGRGAIHFHLCFFVPETLQRLLRIKHRPFLKGHKNMKHSVLDALRIQIQNDWAEVTKEIDGYDVPYTEFDYIRHNKRNPEKSIKKETYKSFGSSKFVETRLANPKTVYKIEPDINHRLYGCNVREVTNWKMFLGYMFKYMKKEVRENPFGLPAYKGEIKSTPKAYPRPPAKVPYLVDLNKKSVKTGRFWGFSYNLDFAALKTGMAGHAEIDNVNDFCNALNALSFARLTEHLVENAKRKKKELKHKPQKLKRTLKQYRFIFESQKKRYKMQKNRINEGYGLQFEINSEVAMKCEKYLRSKSVGEFFDFP